MMNRVTCCVIFLAFAIQILPMNVFGQELLSDQKKENRLSLDLVGHFIPNQDLQYVSTVQLTSIVQLENDYYERSRVERTSIPTLLLRPRIGFTAALSYKLAEWDRFSLYSGVGLGYYATHQETGATEELSSKVISIDTVMLPVFPSVSSTSCDVFIPLENVEVLRGTNFHVVDLMIPLNLRYRFSDRLSLNLGAYLRTALLSASYTERQGLNRTVNDDGQTICEAVLIAEREYTDNGITNSRIGLEANLRFQVEQGISVILGAASELGNVIDNKNQRFFYRTNVPGVKIQRFNIGISLDL